MADSDKTQGYKDTLNLPRTDFPIRPQAALDDPAMISRWSSEQLYEKSFTKHEGNEKYVLHMGPPYANGHIHLGHAYTTILKDIMTKGYRMAGYHTPVTPGWDCHGLPIEIKVVKENPGLDPLELKKACRTYAQGWVDVQREEFRRLGIVMDWDRPYITMAPSYEAKTMNAFSILMDGGFIQRKNKTVYWCFTCKTVLAAAEIEYRERKDPSLYVLFGLPSATSETLFPEAEGEKVSFLIWTTTPWTLPLNRGVLIHPDAEYVLVRLKGSLMIVGARTVPALSKIANEMPQALRVFPGSLLKGVQADHPFDSGRTVPVIFDDSVGLDEGTACVHMAPGCGPVDYELGVKNNLEIYSPISAEGTYTEAIVPHELEGMSVTNAQGWVITSLMQRGMLWHKASITHSYPHCWRCHNGLIFRATKQWFFDLTHKDVKQRALDAVAKITFMPPEGRNFLKATIESRWEWCLSRQRVWGVPIPALLCSTCDYGYSTPEFINSIAEHVAVEGVEYWDRVSVASLVEKFSIKCTQCPQSDFIKEFDILDVWFDSGVSHYAVLCSNPTLTFPADLYLEGIDQHRGWFQSSLLTALVIEGMAPMKAIMTHGFTVDEKGHKMSKSLGNVIAPQDVINQLGTDGLRLWVASVGHDGDALVSKVVLHNVQEVFRKIRNTARFLLANTYDFNPEHDALPLSSMRAIDVTALGDVYALRERVIKDYHAGNFSAVFHALGDYCTVDLSSWYLDIVKDRLYVEKPNGVLRRSAQTALFTILDTMTKLMAPILSFTAEQISDLYQKNKTESIHLQTYSSLPEELGQIAKRDEKLWQLLNEVRSAVLKAIETERESGVIKHSLEARVTLYLDPSVKGYDVIEGFVRNLKAQGETLESFFKEFFIVSQVVVAQSQGDLPVTAFEGLFVRAQTALGTKCPRCWHWDEGDHPHGLCRRCAALVDSM